MKGKWIRLWQAPGRDGERGLTLIELLAVIVILAIIAAIAVPVVLNSMQNAKNSTTKQSMSVIVEALNRYAANSTNGTYPDNLQVLVNEGYLQAVPNDAWGHPFSYSPKDGGNSFTLTTQDGKFNFSSGMTVPSGP